MRGQKSVEELVYHYPIRNQAVRGLLIDYFTRRRADTDCATLKNLVLHLAHHLWEKIERLNPDQVDLRVSPDIYTAWRQMIAVKDNGAPRAGADSLVISVRSFYYDLHSWAAQEPERWATWVAPCPGPPSDLHGLGARRRQINERSADRTRQRQPLLPVLVEHRESRYDHYRQLLQLAEKAVEGETFTFAGTSYTRVLSEADRKLSRHTAPIPPRLRNNDSGEMVHIAAEEETTFWDWAAVETLRHSGVRVEELCELTDLSIRQYQRPAGEVIALLVIAPSKTDRERVIPMSAELGSGQIPRLVDDQQHGRAAPVSSASVLSSLRRRPEPVNVGKFTVHRLDRHLRARDVRGRRPRAEPLLSGRPVTAFPHVRRELADAYVRLVAMKLFSDRAVGAMGMS